ncbi:MAG: hypothetical protein F6K63_11195 [Moorea sp. SIO1G6]|uniref:hypothetical protein n=1 Tax=Moorena sp. SIO1G6 TaxID=2607840 RepID=UPI0013C0DF00|nr:hypothetical protein [Moorena sp. SIO1G6]NES86642.1 hypothetical protein [Moorena sp. SIO2B7]NET64919.1 hypothetical protein [Moorena sp. SIO1G6]
MPVLRKLKLARCQFYANGNWQDASSTPDASSTQDASSGKMPVLPRCQFHISIQK